jgi:acyl-CoA thioesterase-1
MKNSRIKMVGLGDSITYGYPYEPEASWFNMAASQLNIDYVNCGINGDTTDGMVSRFDRDVIHYKPSHLIVMGGTNDAYAGMPANQVIDNICDMVELALKNDIVPMIGLPIPCNDLVEENLLEQYRKGMCQYAVDNNIQVIDFHKAMVDDSGLKIKKGMHYDDVHPNKAGYEVMTSAAIVMLQKILD